MKRCSALCTHGTRVAGFGAQYRRWMTYDKSKLTKEALLEQAESGLGYDADGKPVKIDPDAKTIATAAGNLPISPVMDPAWMRARRQGKKNPAQRPTGRFRRKLTNNPFALALTTPIRKCVNTGVSMPRYFLQDFELVKHPDPEVTSPWWVPGPLAFQKTIPFSKKTRAKEEDLENMPEDGEMATGIKAAFEEDAPEELEIIEPTEMSAVETPKANQEQQLDAGLKAESSETETEILGLGTPGMRRDPGYRAPITGYTLACSSVIYAIGDPTAQRRLLPGLLALRHGMAIKQVKDPVWRPDMSLVLLRKMRTHAVEALVRYAALNRSDRGTFLFRYIEPCAGWEEAGNVFLRGCVLWLPETQDESHRYATLDVQHAKYHRKMPVHNLHWLLGDDCVKQLKEADGVFRDNQLLVLKQSRTDAMMNLHLLLWRLQGYLDRNETEHLDPIKPEDPDPTKTE
ncbi:Fc.00g075040.m01.CDS01 [Cosmosporella sp. VM-42]